MDYSEENSSTRPSQIRPPSRLPSPGKGLAEISESQSNARSKPVSKMPPPKSLKHKLGASFAEPEPKRKTLAEMAGEPRSIVAPTPSARPAVKGTSLVRAGKLSSAHAGHNNSISSSISSRAPSASSRYTSNGSFSSSVGPGNRPASFHGGRPQSSFSQSTTTRPVSGLPKSRPATMMLHNISDDDIPLQNERQGMQPSILIQSVSPRIPVLKNRISQKPQPGSSLRSLPPFKNLRKISVSTAMSSLTVDDLGGIFQDTENQAIAPAKNPQPTTPYNSPITIGSRSVSGNGTNNALVLYQSPEEDLVAPKARSLIPMLSKVETINVSLSKAYKTSKSLPARTPFLTKSSNIPGIVEFDVRGRLETMEAMYYELKDTMSLPNTEQNRIEEIQQLYKTRILELETQRTQLSSSNKTLQNDLDEMRMKSEIFQQKLLVANASVDDQIRAHRLELDDSKREQRNETDKIRRDNTDEIDRIIRLHQEALRELERRAAVEFEDKIRDLERRNTAQLDEERARRLREVQDLESRIASESQNLDLSLQQKQRELQGIKEEFENLKKDLERERSLREAAQNSLVETRDNFQKTGLETASTIQVMENTVASLRARIHFLESGSKAQSDSFAEMEARLQEAIMSAEVSKQKLIKEETRRRSLFNQVQELKGNIRVMCRVRPALNSTNGEIAKLMFPDVDKESKELELLGKEEKSSLGNVTRKTHAFSFDRVFGPESQNQEVFEEISQLVQSALDGYNVCIFCYGQTGSGKTHTMSSTDGMIPRATQQIYEVANNLQEKGWMYTMEGTFVEVYNEDIHDLLGDSREFDKKKHEIRHDENRKQTTVTGLQTVPLDSPNTVEKILKRAANNRSVAATKSNERSSRSHSVFMLKLVGKNSTTGEVSEGTLNLVDLAGSERLKSSGAEGDRMKETQNINKSLACLGDVIGALGQGKEGTHIPYRNSKLTYLLQYSLGGNSKTLMFVMVSPMEAHIQETVTSLKFATKVHNTHIGTAKKSKRSSD